LSRKLRGHDAYYGITGNYQSLAMLRHWVERGWRKWLSSRSRHSRLSWARMRKILKRFGASEGAHRPLSSAARSESLT
jgi:hypothetical protein